MPTKEEMAVAVKMTFGEGASYEIAKAASGGFLSCVQFLTVTKPDGQKVRVVLKVPDVSKIDARYDSVNTPAEDRAIGMPFVAAAHNNEAIFLEILGDFKKSSGELQWMPDVYAAETTECKETGGHLFMEDLSDKGTLPDDFMSQPESLMKDAIAAIADLAYISFADPGVLKKVRPFMEIYDILLPDVRVGLGYLKESYGELFPFEPDQILNSFSMEKYLDKYVRNDKKCPILVHRDCFTRNMLVDKKDPSKFLTHLDWQLGGIGPPGEDLARLLGASLDTEDRRAKTDMYLKFYHDTVKDLCKKHGLESKANFTLEEVKEAYEGAFGYNTLIFCNVSTYCIREIKDKGMKVPESDIERLVRRCYGCVVDAFPRLK